MQLHSPHSRTNGNTFIIVVIIAVILGGLYFFMQKSSDMATDRIETSVDALQKTKSVTEMIGKQVQERDAESEF